MESPHTLLNTPPEWDSSPREGARRRLSARLPAEQSDAPRPAGTALILGRYRLLERLGSGGFGVVWRARDELLAREVAVKRIPLAPDGDSERATREALATARLSHPAIVALYEAHSDPEAFYLISELVHGDTLSRLIAADALGDEESLAIGVALASALSHAHARGVIHRDVKPQNVLIPHSREGRLPASEAPLAVAKLTDFGGASLADHDGLTGTGNVLGTLPYMAPEQCEGGDVGAEADLYALALVLYETLSGVNPVRGATPAATARRIGHELPPLGSHRGDLPPALADALDTALAPAPEQRGTLEELRLTLEETLQRGLRRTWRRQPDRSARTRRQPIQAQRPGPSQPSPAAPGLVHPYPAGVARPQRHAEEPDPEQAQEPRRGAVGGRPALPRLLWWGLALATIVWQVAAGRPGLALLALAAAAPLVALPRRTGPGWLASALAPILGLVGLAAAFPAIAGQVPRWRERAALATLGYWWLTLAEPLLGRRLWLGGPSISHARRGWEGSLAGGAHVIGPLLVPGLLLGALLWAGAAVVLPWIVRGRSAALDVIAATTWSAGLAAAAPMLDSGLSAHAAQASPRGLVLGAVLGGAIAVAARALRGPI